MEIKDDKKGDWQAELQYPCRRRSYSADFKRNIPIIAVTANAFKSDEEYCAEAGMNAHLSKPFDINKLMEVLTSLLDLEYTENEKVQ